MQVVPIRFEDYTDFAIQQYTLLTLVVNTAVIGNYTQPNVGSELVLKVAFRPTNFKIVAVPGILASNATYMNVSVDLVPYFSGGLQSTNRNGTAGKSFHFRDMVRC